MQTVFWGALYSEWGKFYSNYPFIGENKSFLCERALKIIKNNPHGVNMTHELKGAVRSTSYGTNYSRLLGG